MPITLTTPEERQWYDRVEELMQPITMACVDHYRRGSFQMIAPQDDEDIIPSPCCLAQGIFRVKFTDRKKLFGLIPYSVEPKNVVVVRLFYVGKSTPQEVCCTVAGATLGVVLKPLIDQFAAKYGLRSTLTVF